MSMRLFYAYRKHEFINSTGGWGGVGEQTGLAISIISFYFICKRKTHFYANSVDPDQTPHLAASDLGLHRLPMSLFG